MDAYGEPRPGIVEKGRMYCEYTNKKHVLTLPDVMMGSPLGREASQRRCSMFSRLVPHARHLGVLPLRSHSSNPCPSQQS